MRVLSDWPTFPLGEVANFYAGNSLPQGVPFDSQSNGYLLVRVSDMNLPGNEVFLNYSQAWSLSSGAKSATCPPGSLIIPKRGGAIGTNKKRITLRSCVLDPNLMGIWPHPEKLDLRYLYHWFLTFDLISITSGSSVPQLNKQDLSPLSLPLPPIEHQRRVVEVLDKADALRAKRREAIALLDDLARSIFLNMFGDPRTNPRGWTVATFDKVVSEFRYGTSNKSAESGFPALRIPNVVAGTLNVSDLKCVPVKRGELDRLRLQDGDLLFVRTNGNPDYVGRCSLFTKDAVQSTGCDVGNFIYASYLIRARLDEGRVSPVFAREFMLSSAGRAALRERCKTSAGQFNINIEGLKAVPIFLPPLSIQQEFEQRLSAVTTLRADHKAHLAELDALFASLQQRAFRGELWDTRDN